METVSEVYNPYAIEHIKKNKIAVVTGMKINPINGECHKTNLTKTIVTEFSSSFVGNTKCQSLKQSMSNMQLKIRFPPFLRIFHLPLPRFTKKKGTHTR